MDKQELALLADNYRQAGDAIHDAIRESVRAAGGFINCSNNKGEKKDMKVMVFNSKKGYTETFPIRALRIGPDGSVEVYVGTFGTVYTDRYLRGKGSEDHWKTLKNSSILFYQTILSITAVLDEYIPEG